MDPTSSSKPNPIVWFPLGIHVATQWDDENEEYVARIPDVDDLEGRGSTALQAVQDIKYAAFLKLRMG